MFIKVIFVHYIVESDVCLRIPALMQQRENGSRFTVVVPVLKLAYMGFVSVSPSV